MRKLQITFEIPEGYNDAHPDIIIEDMHISKDWKITDVVEISSTQRTCFDSEAPQRAPGTQVLINYNDEAGQDFYSVEASDDVGNWLESFDTYNEALEFIDNHKFIYDSATGFRDTRYPYD